MITITLNPTVDIVYEVDDFKVNEVNRCTRVVRNAGGKGINTARVLTLLGHECYSYGFVGGNNGVLFHKLINQSKIINKMNEISGETRTCINILSNGKSSEILEPGPFISPLELEQFYRDVRLLENEIVCISGSLPLGINNNIYNELTLLLSENNNKVILDTSKASLKAAFNNNPYLIKVNGKEFLEMFDGEDDLLIALEKCDLKRVIVTLGPDGALAKWDNVIYKIIVPEVKVINAVGSGDSVNAGIAAGIKQNLEVEDIIKLGMACGISNAMNEQVGHIEMDVVEELLDQITIFIL